MTEKVGIGLFEKLSLRDWYKYLLYVSGILLILAIFLDTKIERYKVIDFSVWTIGLSIFVWISDIILERIYYYYREERGENSWVSDGEKGAVWVMTIVNVLAFIFWLFIARKLF